MSHCPKCQRPAAPNRDTCLYCGEPIPSDVRESLALRCPRCRGWMNRETVDGLELDICYGCGGTWYDRKELEARLESHLRHEGEPGPEAIRTEDPRTRQGDVEEVAYLECPRCHKRMVRQNFGRTSGIIVDVCGYHGLFLDAGEFERVVDFERDGGTVRARQQELESLNARERELKRDAAARRFRELHSRMSRGHGWWDFFLY